MAHNFQLVTDPTNTESRALPDVLPTSPFPTLTQWLDCAWKKRDQPNPNAMVLSTVGRDGRPSGRVVLCKGMDESAGILTFYTNYISDKAAGIAANPRVALTFHWDAMELQARIEGLAVKITADRSDAYFASRPWESRVGAWSSDQSRPIESRATMLDKVAMTTARFGIDPKDPPATDAKIDIPRPSHWGGYDVIAERVELWVGGAGRVHDRAAWKRPIDDRTHVTGAWTAMRLQP